METTPVALADRLQSIPVFSDLSAADREWLASRMEVASYKPGDVVIAEGSPADRMIVVLEGESFAQREHGPSDGRTFSSRAGNVTGLLPYSRLTIYPLTSRALTPATVAYLHSSHFQEMLERMPALGGRLVGLMSDRIRESTRIDQQRDKLMALGKLSAGLAHELNNPAAAVRNAAVNLKQAVAQLRSTGLALQKCELSAADRTLLAHLECDWASDHPPAALDSLERSDREEDIGTWLESHGIANARSLAPLLVDAGCDMETLRGLGARFDDRILTQVVTRLATSFTVGSLVEQIESGTSRISELVRAIKQYSYMDQAPEQEIDVHEGLENTLIMLHYRLKHGVNVVREYDRSLPRICARGSELNQVWTNLIDNAIDAMDGRGELLVRTASEFGRVLVEIRDSGPGIPPEARDHIFEPFFTTKPVGEGTGLGLDTVYRIVQSHQGTIRVDSKPGRTSFEVRIPFADAGRGEHGSL
ncbi:MAG TPA: ATP-binding protein [Candidatus Acidoferrum sp.]|nr:ATP-binding protein [Candidatus Acidoferrum sp.]